MTTVSALAIDGAARPTATIAATIYPNFFMLPPPALRKIEHRTYNNVPASAEENSEQLFRLKALIDPLRAIP